MSAFVGLMHRLLGGHDLSRSDAEDCMEMLLAGQLGPIRSGSLLTALAAKGVTDREVTGFATTMRRHAHLVHHPKRVLDTCGTGGSGLPTLNTSTLCALICAAAGVKVAKHGNRASSGKCGSMDVLEHLGVNIDIEPAQAQALLTRSEVVFLNARRHHPALGPLGPVRKALGFRTVFNLLGPICNPATPTHQLIGVSDPAYAPLMLKALRELGTQRAMVVHGEDGLDEISLAGGTRYWELLDDGKIYDGLIVPEDYGLKRAPFGATAGGGVAANAQRFLDLLQGEEHGPARDHTLLNAGAALYIAGKAGDIESGIAKATRAIDSGNAYRIFLAYKAASQALAG